MVRLLVDTLPVPVLAFLCYQYKPAYLRCIFPEEKCSAATRIPSSFPSSSILQLPRNKRDSNNKSKLEFVLKQNNCIVIRVRSDPGFFLCLAATTNFFEPTEFQRSFSKTPQLRFMHIGKHLE
jgi:hypothetical protein